ncbi:hypothetical protein I3843_02G104700 [Carya illinoinensis]|nr:hypothetical protein I3843_02G104700 [Carya illinoinensis]
METTRDGHRSCRSPATARGKSTSECWDFHLLQS